MSCTKCRPIVVAGSGGGGGLVTATGPLVATPSGPDTNIAIQPGAPNQALVTDDAGNVAWGPVLMTGTQLVPITAGTNGAATGSSRQRWMRVGDFVQGHGVMAVGVLNAAQAGSVTVPLPFPVASGTTAIGTLIGNFDAQKKIGHSIGGPNNTNIEFSISADYTAVDVVSYTFAFAAEPIAP